MTSATAINLTEYQRKATVRANSLKLSPRKPQTNSFKHFTMSAPATDMDIVANNRMNSCVIMRNRGFR